MEHARNLSENNLDHREVTKGYDALAVAGKDGHYKLSVMVSGVHCAGCIQKIESALMRQPDVAGARLNFSTRRLGLDWKGTATRANDLVTLVQNLGYTISPYDPGIEREETKAQGRFLLLCLGVSGFAVGNIMLLSVGVWAAGDELMGVATRELMHWLSALIAIPAVMFSGRPFFRSAFKALSSGHTNMDVPISLAIILAPIMSVVEMLRHGPYVYFDSAVMLIFFLLIGRYLDFRARQNARSTATDLLGSFSGFANVIEGETIRSLPIRDVREGMYLQVAAGQKFPVDGTVTEGNTSVDTSLVTGETMPRPAGTGSEVYAGTLNLDAPVVILVARAAEDSLLADIVRLMEKAGQGQAKYVRLADRIAKAYTPAVHILAAGAFLGWLFLGGVEWQQALLIATTVLIITCPCALGLVVPVVQVLATGRLMKSGILVKSGDALERLATIDTIIFDKTGTLTVGMPVLEGSPDKDLLARAASLAAYSAHPLSKALRSAYSGKLISLQSISEHPGKGMEAVLDGIRIRLGSRDWCGDKTAAPAKGMELWFDDGASHKSVFHFSDQLRPDAIESIANLQKRGLRLIMLSGDRESVAQDLAKQCGITEILAEKTPPEKYAFLENLKDEGRHVLMVGDGLNDAPALAQADVSMAPGTAIDMAQNAADIIFMKGDLDAVVTAMDTAHLTQDLTRQNFILSIAYNVMVVPLALAGMVTPLIASLAMSSSSLIVIGNSFRLRKTKP